MQVGFELSEGLGLTGSLVDVFWVSPHYEPDETL